MFGDSELPFYIRLNNLLSPQNSNLAVDSVNQDTGQHEDEMIPKFREDFLKQYQDLINQRPIRPQVGKLKRIQGGLATLAGNTPEQKEALRANVLYGGQGGYNQQMNDWTTQLENFKELSRMEGSRNINERAALASANREKIGQRRLDITESRNEQIRKTEEGKLEIARDRAETYRKIGEARDWNLRHPNYEAQKDSKTGKIIYVNKTDPNDVITTEIEHGKLDDMQKADLNLRNRLESIKARGKENRETKETIPGRNPLTGTGRTGSESGSSVKARQYSKAREAYNTHPEWQPYIHLATGNDFTIETPKAGWLGKGGGDPKVTEQIQKFIYGDSQASPEVVKPKPEAAKPVIKPPAKQSSGDKRQRAIDILTKDPRKPRVTESNIQYVMSMLED